jgi:DNA-directed RNA polymerase subunit omega
MEKKMSENVDRAYSEDRTMGLTSQQAVEAVGNRYDLVLIASQRVRELNSGHRPRVESRHGPVLTALKEIEQGHVDRKYLLKSTKDDQKHQGHR